MKRIIGWLRVLSPVHHVVGGTLTVTVSLLAFYSIVWMVPDSRISKLSVTGYWTIFRFIPDKIAIIGAAAYGVVRAVYFHPIFRQQYSRWLATLPWKAPRPLPLGPVTICLQDLAWLLVFAALCSAAGSIMPIVWMGMAAATTYLACLAFCFLRAGPYWAGYLILAGLGGLADLHLRQVIIGQNRFTFRSGGFAQTIDPTVVFGVTVGLYLVMILASQLALRQQLQRFPWEVNCFALLETRKSRTSNKPWARSKLGWPLALLKPEVRAPGPMSRAERVTIACLVTAVVYALADLGDCMLSGMMRAEWRSRGPESATFSVIGSNLGILSVVTIPTILRRLVVRLLRYWPPISIWGRIFTGRLVLPGYDQIFVAPLAVGLVGTAGSYVAAYQGVWSIPILAGTALLMMIIHNLVPPDEESWRYTGHFRLSQIQISGQEKTLPRDHFWQ